MPDDTPPDAPPATPPPQTTRNHHPTPRTHQTPAPAAACVNCARHSLRHTSPLPTPRHCPPYRAPQKKICHSGDCPPAPSPCPNQCENSPRRPATHRPKDKSADHPRVPPSPILPPSADANRPKRNNPAHFAGSYSLWDVYCRRSRPSCRLGRKSDLRSHRLPHRTGTAAPSLRTGRYKRRREKQRAAVVCRSSLIPPHDEGSFGDRTIARSAAGAVYAASSAGAAATSTGSAALPSPPGLSFGQHPGLPAAPQRPTRQTRQERAPNPPKPRSRLRPPQNMTCDTALEINAMAIEVIPINPTPHE